jgi:lipopolysaccharide export system ATP-binding protein
MSIIKKFRIKSFKKINSIIEFENISLAYGNRLILDNISFKINEGQIFGMLGPNGVGKSTIFNLITGLINPNNGKIKITGEDVTQYPVYLRT